MADEFTVTLEAKPTPETSNAIESVLTDFNRRSIEDENSQPLTLVVRNSEGEVVGGLRANTYWDWLYVETLGLRDEARGQGIGTQLLQMAEAEAVRRGCRHAHLDTLSFQARPFYEKQGYVVFGKLENFVGEHTRYFLRKELSVAS